MLLRLKKRFSPDYSRKNLRYDRPKKFPAKLYGVNLWLNTVSGTGAMGDPANNKRALEYPANNKKDIGVASQQWQSIRVPSQQ